MFTCIFSADATIIGEYQPDDQMSSVKTGNECYITDVGKKRISESVMSTFLVVLRVVCLYFFKLFLLGLALRA